MDDFGADPALAKAEPVARLGPSGFDPSRWQPIETAPKGTLALVFDNGLVGSALLSQRGEWLNVSIGANGKINPTHWMTLPQPPTRDL